MCETLQFANNRPQGDTVLEPAPQAQDYAEMFEDIAEPRDTTEDDRPLNVSNMERISNQYVEGLPRAKSSELRNSIRDHIYNCGIRWTKTTTKDYLSAYDM